MPQLCTFCQPLDRVRGLSGVGARTSQLTLMQLFGQDREQAKLFWGCFLRHKDSTQLKGRFLVAPCCSQGETLLVTLQCHLSGGLSVCGIFSNFVFTQNFFQSKFVFTSKKITHFHFLGRARL